MCAVKTISECFSHTDRRHGESIENSLCKGHFTAEKEHKILKHVKSEFCLADLLKSNHFTRHAIDFKRFTRDLIEGKHLK
jgi:hypothetical protein